jgi:protoheme IX farnesyltransferase
MASQLQRHDEVLDLMIDRQPSTQTGAAPASRAATAGDLAAPPRQQRRLVAVVRAYLELIKARLVLLVVGTAAVGFLLAPSAKLALTRLVVTLAGTFLAAAGSMALNERIEAARDGLMERTRARPVPAGTIGPRTAAGFGITVATAGLLTLALGASPLTAALGLAVVLLYALVYTPLKTRTPMCTLAGAACGAIPPMMGWTATGAGLGYGAWLLAGVLFLWQIPHFLALAWLYRDDYRRGGFRMLPVVEPSGILTGSAAVLYSLALVPVGILAALGGITSWRFAAGALVLGAALTALALQLATRRSNAAARRVFLATLAYLPLLLGMMVADRKAPVPVSPGFAAVGVHVTPSPTTLAHPRATLVTAR